jgi:hypothetical protein
MPITERHPDVTNAPGTNGAQETPRPGSHQPTGGAGCMTTTNPVNTTPVLVDRPVGRWKTSWTDTVSARQILTTTSPTASSSP